MAAWLALIPVISNLLDRIIPDPKAAAEAKLELMKQENADELQKLQLAAQADLAQIEVNKIEAASNSIFVAGWRPFVGWVCGSAFAYNFVLQPFLIFIFFACGSTADFTKLPTLDWEQLAPVLLGMLGFGAMRSYDKKKTLDAK